MASYRRTKMNILLIGKHGQLGSELLPALREAGSQVRAFGHEQLDITDWVKVGSVLKKLHPDTLINTSAYNKLTDAETDPQKAFEVNAFGLKNLSVVCRELNIRLVTYSTDYVFDGKKRSPYIETDTPNPLQMYGVSKFAGEIICQNYLPQSIIIRTCGVYGGKLGSRQKKGNIVLSILKDAKEKASLDVSSEQIVSPTYAKDLAIATVRLLRKKSSRGIYHLVNEGKCSWYEFAKEIVRLKNFDCKVKPIHRHGTYAGISRPVFSALSNTRAKQHGIILPSWRVGLKRYLSENTL